jgi:hypothetical protein
MSDRPQRLTREQILALKYAAHRQLARWTKTRPLPPPTKRAAQPSSTPPFVGLSQRARENSNP